MAEVWQIHSDPLADFEGMTTVAGRLLEAEGLGWYRTDDADGAVIHAIGKDANGADVAVPIPAYVVDHNVYRGVIGG